MRGTIPKPETMPPVSVLAWVARASKDAAKPGPPCNNPSPRKQGKNSLICSRKIDEISPSTSTAEKKSTGKKILLQERKHELFFIFPCENRRKGLFPKMAKFDAADPRWIVEIRNEDGHNLNQWHWTDRSLLPWCEGRLKELLAEEQEFGSTPLYVFYWKKIEHVKGDVSLMMRKGRSVVTYEVDLKLLWKARSVADGETVAEGTAHLPYISDENDLDDFEIKWAMTTARSAVSDDARAKAHEAAKPVLKRVIPQFLAELLSTHSSKHGAQVGSVPPSQPSKPAVETPNLTSPSSPSTSSSSCSGGVPLAKVSSGGIKVSCLKMNLDFAGPPGELFDCFADKRRVQVYAGSDCALEFSVGGSFSLFDGNISGKIVDIHPRQKLSMTWRISSWPKEHYSLVTITFQPSSSGTNLSVVQDNVPEGEVDRTRDGWTRFYWERISSCFGCGHKILPN